MKNDGDWLKELVDRRAQLASDIFAIEGVFKALIVCGLLLLIYAAVGHPVKVTPLGPVPGFDVPPALPVPQMDKPEPLPGGRSYVSREQFLEEQELERYRVSRLKD